jgi:hypothetical protein
MSNKTTPREACFVTEESVNLCILSKENVFFITLALRYFMWVDVVKWLQNNPKSEGKLG